MQNGRWWVAWLLLIFLALIWGSSFILIKYGLFYVNTEGQKLPTFDGFQLGALRIFIASIVLLPFLFKHLKREYLKKWKSLLIVGLCGNGIPAFLFGLAEESLDSGLVGMMNSFTAVFTLVIGILIFRLRPKWVNMIGVSIATVGAVILGTAGYNGSVGSFWGLLLVIIATLMYAISLNTIKYKLSSVPSIAITAISFLFIGPLCGILAFSFGAADVAKHIEGGMFSLLMISILSVVGTAFAVIVFNYVIKSSSALFASSVTYLIPIVALLWGLADGELLSSLHLVGMVTICVGVYLVNRR
ncbi:MAG: DMT family transporter [Flavobacteriales bacterium]